MTPNGPGQRPAVFEHHFVPDSRARLNAVRSGQANLALIEPRQIQEAKAAGFQVQINEKNSTWDIYVNAHRDNLKDLRVRQAMMHALDREAVAGALAFGAVNEGDERVLLIRSQRYMNESGPSIVGVARKHDVPAERIVCVHDELDLVLGALQVRIGGGSAGHNGVKSLTSALGTPDFLRVRCGIGRPPGRQDPADFVLEPFRTAERDVAMELVDDAADAILTLVRDGIARAQDRYNRSGPRGA